MDHSFSSNSNIYRFDSTTNTVQSPLVRWKPQTFFQQYPTRQKNGLMQFTPPNNNPYFHPLPLKIYRNELNFTPVVVSMPPRMIGLMEQPGSTVLSYVSPSANQQRLVSDVKEINKNKLVEMVNSTTLNSEGETVNFCSSNATNALTRVRNKFVKIPPRAKCCPAKQTIYTKNKMFQQVHQNVNDCKKYDCKTVKKEQSCC
jgi:hypothetical protein